MSPEERWSFAEARRLRNSADARFREFAVSPPADGSDLEADAEDARLVGDADLFDRVIEESEKRGDFWQRASWYEYLTERATEERDLALLRSVARSKVLIAEAEFRRRNDNLPTTGEWR